MARTWTTWGSGAALVFSLLACAGTPETVEPPVPAEPAPAPSPAPAAPDASTARIPKGPIDGAWIGMAARAANPEAPDAPIDAALVVWDGIEAFRAVPAGALAWVVGEKGPIEVRLRDVRKIPFGCDGLEQEVAVFDGPELQRGPVWLVSEESKARFEPAVEVSKTERRLEWTVGQLGVVTEGTKKGGRTVVSSKEGEERWRKDWEGHPDVDPLTVGAWIPRGLVRSPDERTLLFSWQSLEGFHYSAVRMDPKATRPIEPEVYLYWCAY